MAATDLARVVAPNAVRPGRSQPAGSCSQDGYTLIEALIVLAIASIMATMLLGGVRQIQGLLALKDRSNAQSVADAIADYVADDLAGALQLPLLATAWDEQVPMAGSSREIRFNAVVRVGFLQRALREVSFRTETPAGSPTLVRTLRLRRLGETEPTRGEEALVLHPEILGITFQYMTRDGGGNAVWSDDWNARGELPIAVRFQIELVAKGNQIRVSRMVGMLK